MLTSIKGQIETTEESLKEFIFKYAPDAVYSSLQSSKADWIQKDIHLDRLARSAAILGIALDPDYRSRISGILSSFTAHVGENIVSLRCCIMIQIIEEESEYFGYCSIQSKGPEITSIAAYANVMTINEGPRKSPNAKTTTWIRERAWIESQKPGLVQEVLLCKDFQVYEGLITNFWALRVIDGETFLETAPFTSVLVGTVSLGLVEVARNMGLRISFRCPMLNEDWLGCFITSAYRWVQPIQELSSMHLDQSNFEPMKFANFEMILKIQAELVNFMLLSIKSPFIHECKKT